MRHVDRGWRRKVAGIAGSNIGFRSATTLPAAATPHDAAAAATVPIAVTIFTVTVIVTVIVTVTVTVAVTITVTDFATAVVAAGRVRRAAPA